MKTGTSILLGWACIILLSACSKDAAIGDASGEATAQTIKANAEFAHTLPLTDQRDFDEAKRGLIARPTGQIRAADGSVLIDFEAFKFIDGAAPATVNPSLWRHAKLNAEIGLFKVTQGIYQLRGFDIANMTLIEGKTGWIVIDPLTASETSAAALAFAQAQLGQRPVSALIFTHSHADHFGGALGILSPEEIAARKIAVIAPDGFMEEATSENMMVGTAMGRRSIYQFGSFLERNPKGFVDNGLGKTVAYGKLGILNPNRLITAATEEMLVDGVRFVFHNVPGAEAPSELTFSLPEMKAYAGAEILAQTMHNLLPVRGAKARDALRWSSYLDQALVHSADAEVYFGQHNWPLWGQARIAGFITQQRDVYRYMHDQTVRLMNAGYTANDIADMVKLPKSLETALGVRGYYGDLRHNVRAIYQFYLGFYDGNPAHLNPLPPQESAKRYLDLLGGADTVVAKAQAAFDKGDYRWAVELLNHVMFGAPADKNANQLLAQTYEQMGYVAEAATWRNSYLSAAKELRDGPPKKSDSRRLVVDMLMQTPIDLYLEAIAASLDGPAADGKDWKINLVFKDLGVSYVLWLENAVLHHKQSLPAKDANATLTLTKPIFVQMMAGTADVKNTLLNENLNVSGSKIDLVRFFALFDKAPGTFNIVAPN
jgi:alkyl sulfatase BDS1-like metallo-beta-lactamase superfamily hydrolase